MPMLQLYLQQASSNQSSHPDLSYNHAKGDILEMCNDSEIQSNAPFHSPSLVLKDLDILLSQITKRITMQLPANKIPSQVPIKKYIYSLLGFLPRPWKAITMIPSMSLERTQEIPANPHNFHQNIKATGEQRKG